MDYAPFPVPTVMNRFRVLHMNMALKTLVGAWLGSDMKKNEQEIEGVIKVAKAGHADIVAVGNEVLLRGDLTEDQIIDCINRLKSEVPDIPVGYVDAYYEFELHPELRETCDVILANCYPFWEGYPLEHSLLYMKEMYHRAVKAGKEKRSLSVKLAGQILDHRTERLYLHMKMQSSILSILIHGRMKKILMFFIFRVLMKHGK